MVVNVRLLGVVALLLLAVIMAMGEFVVIVLVRVPIDAVFHLTGVINVVRYVPVVVSVGDVGMGMLWFPAFTFGSLLLGQR
jgi:hypothetical protein